MFIYFIFARLKKYVFNCRFIIYMQIWLFNLPLLANNTLTVVNVDFLVVLETHVVNAEMLMWQLICNCNWNFSVYERSQAGMWNIFIIISYLIEILITVLFYLLFIFFVTSHFLIFFFIHFYFYFSSLFAFHNFCIFILRTYYIHTE